MQLKIQNINKIVEYVKTIRLILTDWLVDISYNHDTIWLKSNRSVGKGRKM